MRDQFNVVDADCHILEPPTALYDLIEPKFRDRAPRVIEIDGKQFWEGEPFNKVGGHVSPSQGLAPASGIVGMAGIRRWGDQATYTGGDLKYTDGNAAGFRPDARLKEFEEEGIDQGVFFRPGSWLSCRMSSLVMLSFGPTTIGCRGSAGTRRIASSERLRSS